MPKWLFTTGMTRGSYTAVESDGELREVTGLDLCLGVEEGEDLKEAITKLTTRLAKAAAIPAYMKTTVTAIELGSMKQVNIKDFLEKGKIQAEVDDKTPLKASKLTQADQPEKDFAGGYKQKICEFCGEKVASNGAAQYSHLRKHIAQMLSKNALTREQAAGIRSTKLTPEMLKLFTEFFKK